MSWKKHLFVLAILWLSVSANLIAVQLNVKITTRSRRGSTRSTTRIESLPHSSGRAATATPTTF